jgi:dipeptidyl-peptidase-3
LSAEKFQKIVEAGNNKEAISLFASIKEKLYSSSSRELSLGLEDQGISTYYSENITRKDVEKVRPFMQQKGISPYNTRLWKLDENVYEIKKASAVQKETETHEFNGMTLR